MFTRLALLATVGLALVVGTGCTGKTADQRDSLADQNKRLADQLEAQRRANEDMQRRLDALQNTAPSTPSTPDMGTAPVEPTTPPVAGGTVKPPKDIGEGVTVGKKHGLDVIQIPGDVLFDSGKATLKPSAMKSLDKVAALIKKDYNGQQLEIGGHTDPNPVRKSGWDDNWDLGSARARAVLLYLEKKGISQKHMHTASYAANEPKSTKNLALNRRVEILVQK